jgi:DNA end-binding protein Ku
MAARPYWSGQIRISLVTMNVDLFSATVRASQTPLHELQRSTGERIHHQNINGDGETVDEEDIVKGFEIEKDEYVFLEKKELDDLRLESSDTLELTQFVDADAIPLMHYERPYYVLPGGKDDGQVYAVIAEALRSTGKIGIGQITLRGREELCALAPFDKGLIIETLRYDAELQDAHKFYGSLKDKIVKTDQVALAKQLITQNTQTPRLDRFHDRYHEALAELVEAKRHHRKPKTFKPVHKTAKPGNFMEALQRSLKLGQKPKVKPSANSNTAASKTGAKPQRKHA